MVSASSEEAAFFFAIAQTNPPCLLIHSSTAVLSLWAILCRIVGFSRLSFTSNVNTFFSSRINSLLKSPAALRGVSILPVFPTPFNIERVGSPVDAEQHAQSQLDVIKRKQNYLHNSPNILSRGGLTDENGM